MFNRKNIPNSVSQFRKNRLQTKKAFNPFSLIFDKDKRAAMVWICTAIGGIFIVGYYVMLDGGFTPDINLGQASFLFIQSFVVGTTLVGTMSIGVFAPAFAYRIVAIDIDAIQSKEETRALMKRGVVAQIFIVSAFLTLFTYPNNDNLNDNLFWATFTEICIFSAIAQCFQERITQFSSRETEKNYWKSLAALWLLGFFGFFFLWVLYSSATSEKRANDWMFFGTWLVIVLYSSIFAVQKKKNIVPVIVIFFGLFVVVLSSLNMLKWPFNATAYKIGIAEPNPVTLILPKETCLLFKSTLSASSQKLECEGNEAGVLNNVNLLNSLGTRWIIKTSKDSGNIVFDGKGVIIQKKNNAKK